MSDLALFRSANHWLSDERLSDERKGKLKNERMSVSDPGEKIEWGAESELRKNERVPSSANCTVLQRIKVPQLYAGLFVHNFILHGQSGEL
jgi:hypothetical protein